MLMEIKAVLAENGVVVDIDTLWRFFDRCRIALEKVNASRGAGSSRRPEVRRGLV